jgi:hypothetical protein
MILVYNTSFIVGSIISVVTKEVVFIALLDLSYSYNIVIYVWHVSIQFLLIGTLKNIRGHH